MSVLAQVLTVVAVSSLAASFQQARDPSPATPLRTGSAVVSGTVVADDELKRPIRRATVTVIEESGGSSGRMTVTNDAGEFSVTGLPAGRYMVTATKGAYLPAAYGATKQHRPGTVRSGTSVAVSDGQAVTGLVLSMMRGAVITGVIHDETGRPARGISLSVSYFARSPQNGERILNRLTYEGTAVTDSRGVYRIWGLPPGDYLIAGLPSGPTANDLMLTTDMELSRATATARPDRPASLTVARPRVGFVPVYFPGTTSASNATPVRVGPAEERVGISFAMQLVPNSRVEGAVIGMDGQPVPSAPVLVYSEAKPAGIDANRLGARTDALGRFSLRGLSPGSYTIASSSGDAWGTTSIAVQGDDVSANIQLRAAILMTGTIGVDDSASTGPPDFSRVRFRLIAESSALPLANGGYTITADTAGRFKVPLMPGRYRFQVSASFPGGTTSTWILKSAIVGKQDLADIAFEVGEGDRLPEAALTLTNRTAELSGRMTGAEGRAAPEYFVIVFPTDSAFWGWQARRIQQARPSHDGTFAFRSLPAGEYFIAAVTDVEQNEWFDLEFLKSLMDASIRVALPAGEKKTQLIQVK